MTSENKQVVVYVRESNHDGAAECLERQAQKVQSYCKQQGYDVSETVSTIGSRAESLDALKKAIEYAKNTDTKTIVMASSNRVVGTPSELNAVADAFDESKVSIVTMDGSYENAVKYGVSTEALISNTLSAIGDDTTE